MDRYIRSRLSLLVFLQFAVWGCYLVSLGQYLGSAGLGAEIQWFYAAGGMVALFMPALIGSIADRFVPAQRLLGLCHLIAAIFMGITWWYGHTHSHPEFSCLFIPYVISAAFFLPTVALCNSVSFALLERNGYDKTRTFPSVRVWGTVGFVAAMWAVNSIWYNDGSIGITLSESNPEAPYRFQYTDMQLLAAAVTGLVTCAYTFSLPAVKTSRKRTETTGGKRSVPVIGAFSQLANRKLLPFFIFSMLIGVALQINNGYVTPYLTHFKGLPQYAASFGANNATLLSSLSQISEAVWILPVGFILARIGIKATILTAIAAWAVNFLSFAFGNPGDGLWLIVIGMLVYGIAFNFFNVAGAIFIDRNAPSTDRSAAQGLFMMMTKGIGASAGILGAGAVINTLCHWQIIDSGRYFTGDWTTAWIIFAGYCVVVGVLFALLFRSPENTTKK